MTFDIGSPEMSLERFGLSNEPSVVEQLNAKTFRGCIEQYEGEPVEAAQKLLSLAAGFSVAPISGFHVGAVAIGVSGKLYLGANMEFVGVPLSASLHAEQSAVLVARVHGEKQIEHIIISAAPCGHCRQFLCELPEAGGIQLHFEGRSMSLSELLPDAFGLEAAGSGDLFDRASVSLESAQPITSDLARSAVQAAEEGYTPYTQSPEGVAIECVNGVTFLGRSAESAAFNPSVPAVVDALNQRNFSHSRTDQIHVCAHARLATSLSAQSDFTHSLLRRITNAKVQSIILETC